LNLFIANSTGGRELARYSCDSDGKPNLTAILRTLQDSLIAQTDYLTDPAHKFALTNLMCSKHGLSGL
jgi:hypothetical protein